MGGLMCLTQYCDKLKDDETFSSPVKETVAKYLNIKVRNIKLCQKLDINFSLDCVSSAAEPLLSILKRTIKNDKELDEHFTSEPPRILNGKDYCVMTGNGRPIQIAKTDSSLIIMGLDTKSKKLVAVKIIYDVRMSLQNMLVEFMLQEKAHKILSGSSCKTPKPIGFLHLKQCMKFQMFPLLIVMPFCGFLHNYLIGVSLEEALLHDFNKVKDEQRLVDRKDYAGLCLGLINAVTLLQRNGIYHLDIKPGNIMLQHIQDGLTSKVFPLLIDYGLSVAQTSRDWIPFKGKASTFPHTPPEMFQQAKPHPTSDLFSVAYVIKCVGSCLKMRNLKEDMAKYLKDQPSQRQDSDFLQGKIESAFSMSVPNKLREQNTRTNEVATNSPDQMEHMEILKKARQHMQIPANDKSLFKNVSKETDSLKGKAIHAQQDYESLKVGLKDVEKTPQGSEPVHQTGESKEKNKHQHINELSRDEPDDEFQGIKNAKKRKLID